MQDQIMSLNNRQKRHLKGLAHHLEPVLRIGKARITPQLLAEAEKTLNSHELIKMRIELDDSKERRQLAAALAEQTSAQLVTSVGKVAILFRQRDEDSKIKLPQ